MTGTGIVDLPHEHLSDANGVIERSVSRTISVIGSTVSFLRLVITPKAGETQLKVEGSLDVRRESTAGLSMLQLSNPSRSPRIQVPGPSVVDDAFHRIRAYVAGER